MLWLVEFTNLDTKVVCKQKNVICDNQNIHELIFCTGCLNHEDFECVWLFTEGKIHVPLVLATNGSRDLTLANTYVIT